MDIATFRADFPEFEDTGRFPNSTVTYYLNLAGLLLNTQRWGNLLDTATELFVAHNISLEATANRVAAFGGIPGAMTGPVASKEVDKGSISYDTQAAAEPDAGHWALTQYGARFIRLARMAGAGPVQVGTGWPC